MAAAANNMGKIFPVLHGRGISPHRKIFFGSVEIEFTAYECSKDSKHN